MHGQTRRARVSEAPEILNGPDATDIGTVIAGRTQPGAGRTAGQPDGRPGADKLSKEVP